MVKKKQKKRDPQAGIVYRTERERAGLSQEKAAELIGISVRTLQCYEAGEAEPKLSTADRIAAIYGCTVHALICRPRKGGILMYRYTSVRIRVLGMGAEHPYTCGILIQELEEGHIVETSFIPHVSQDEAAVRRFAERCTREQLAPAKLLEALEAAFPDAATTFR